jgi:hypothetical protein
MKPLVINYEDAEELEEAVKYYEKKRRGLGIDLANKVDEAFLRIQQNPGIYPFHNETRIQKSWSEHSRIREDTNRSGT